MCKVNQIEEVAQLLKEKIVTNFGSQSKTGTVVKYGSLFDFSNLIDFESRMEYLKELHAIYCISYNHRVLQNEVEVLT